ncbi:YebC/PmpR family DNA-binding transcriptional regulator [Enterobacteriaceae endosymbiont of Donacia proxima]|uniref:YebC/PmpR family DNA-binding transcriptional regulator n=1 Tax=Enterobacteriaceae endosymbiont of Donacia proxima TaxID=2675782 RepID=UPI0014703B51|nr:YebC/PmpR family DNA-binding transcriptional regulator [Enterobacteriaceae endosymbiont of Donacia proxima]
MSGHSKWSNTRHRKESQDNKKDKIFSKIIKELNSAIQIGKGINPQYNSKLRLVIEKALAHNMSRITINNILKKNLSKTNKNQLKEIYYEGYGPENVALLIKCLTNNNNRTISFIRKILNKIGGDLKQKGAVDYMFNKQIYVTYLYKKNIDYIIDIAEKLKANDIFLNKKNIKIIFTKEKYKFLTKEIKKFKIKPIKIKLNIKPFIKKKISIFTKKKLIYLKSLCKKNKDIKNFYHNAEF